MTIYRDPELAQLLELPSLSFTNDEWDALTNKPRTQLPPCCGMIEDLAQTIRSIRNYGMDYQNAKDLVRDFRLVSTYHNMMMFENLVRLISCAVDFVEACDYFKIELTPSASSGGLSYYSHEWYAKYGYR